MPLRLPVLATETLMFTFSPGATVVGEIASELRLIRLKAAGFALLMMAKTVKWLTGAVMV